SLVTYTTLFRSDLAIHDHGVHAFLAAELFVDHGFGDLCPGGDLLHAGAPEPLLGEQRACNLEQLLAALMAAHPRTGRLLGFTHVSMMPCEAMPGVERPKMAGADVSHSPFLEVRRRVGRRVAGRVPPGARACPDQAIRMPTMAALIRFASVPASTARSPSWAMSPRRFGAQIG